MFFNEITFYDTSVYKCNTLFKAHIRPHNGHLGLLDTGVSYNINNGYILLCAHLACTPKWKGENISVIL